jgi:hypothetical protein
MPAVPKTVAKTTSTVGPTLNPVRPAPMPAAKQLKNLLAAWAFHSPNQQIPWSTKKPAGAVLSSVVVSKPKKGSTGDTITAYQLASDPSKVYFSKGGSSQMHYYGPVDSTRMPKVMPSR